MWRRSHGVPFEESIGALVGQSPTLELEPPTKQVSLAFVMGLAD